MQVKKFRSETFEEALQQVKRELGPSAVILSKRIIRDSQKGILSFVKKPLVELTAAIDKRLLAQSRTQAAINETIKENAASPMTIAATKRSEGDMITFSSKAKRMIPPKKRVIRNLNKKYIEIDDEDTLENLTAAAAVRKQSKELLKKAKQKVTQINQKHSNNNFKNAAPVSNNDSEKLPKALKNLYAKLSLGGVDAAYIDELITAITDNMNPLLFKRENYIEDFAVKFLMERMQFAGGIELFNHSSKVVVLMGPTGVGKTTTIAKLASQFQEADKKVAVVTLDVFRIGAVDQLRIFSNILKFPLYVLSNQDELGATINKLREYELILIDTAGQSRRDLDNIASMKNTLSLNLPMEKHLCLSASMKDLDALQAFNRFSIMKPDRIIFTKLDDTSVFGGIYNIMNKINVPVSYFTSGQKVPKDIEIGTKERLIDLLLKLSGH